MQLPQTGRHIEGDVRVAPLVILGEMAGENAIGRAELDCRQLSAAPPRASKTRTPPGWARRYTRVPRSGRRSGGVRTLSRASPSVTLTMTSLPSGSDTR